ncbi:hypothetical protein PSU4_22340 [Pseudonocardia sulfidoxydans NBRC 16205]|uniref:Uncharacterized protein n=1 Tax=Pseudonocardia sulfidoxydans NBRC 16205 TaxID=1223511 RepID=A0A511DEQ7_9PSEU|nr:hypothetical protein [Pseudonocardia sulfidoxydans]GEL23280.1 hypothetical protein PSU4_22340 [Pseudonocardia sulfidoxydans NBRC 16205]
MTGRRRLALFGVCLVVLLGVAWYAGSRPGSGGPPPSVTGSVRLGPDPGAAVADYLASLPATLPEPGVAVPALVQLHTAVTGDQAVALAGDAAILQVVWRVPIPRVQTALRFETLDAGVAVGTAVDVSRQRAQLAAQADASRRTGRPGAVAAAEQAALGNADCACVVAVVVRTDRAGLETITARAGVRGVQAAPAGAVLTDLALAPLLPEQTDRVDPLPDDGVVPPAPTG